MTERPAHLERVHRQRQRAESFGAVADEYDRIRPSYPPELIDELVERLAQRSGDVLDIGCGTGKAGRLLVEREVAVLGVEVDPAMAVVAREHGLAVEVCSFEAWDDAGRTFDLIISGQAWHWIDPDVGVTKAARLLRPEATLALFWNVAELAVDVRNDLDRVYRRLAPQLLNQASGGGSDEPPYAGDLVCSGLFRSVDQHRYRWQARYSRDQWVRLISTHSDHLTLSHWRRARLIGEVGDMIDRHGGAIVADYQTYAVLARV